MSLPWEHFWVNILVTLQSPRIVVLLQLFWTFFFIPPKNFTSFTLIICLLCFWNNSGVAPPSFLAIQAGQTLNTMTSSSDAFSLRSMAMLVVFAFVSLLPVLFKKQLKQKLQ